MSMMFGKVKTTLDQSPADCNLVLLGVTGSGKSGSTCVFLKFPHELQKLPFSVSPGIRISFSVRRPVALVFPLNFLPVTSSLVLQR